MNNAQAQLETKEPVLMPVLPLSPTEQAVFRLLVSGLTEKRVAETMNRSPNTIHVHVRNIYRKLGVNRREALINLYMLHGDLLIQGRLNG